MIFREALRHITPHQSGIFCAGEIYERPLKNLTERFVQKAPKCSFFLGHAVRPVAAGTARKALTYITAKKDATGAWGSTQAAIMEGRRICAGRWSLL
jgi:hypothetical protein